MRVYYLVREDRNMSNAGDILDVSHYHIHGMYLSEKSVAKAMRDLIESYFNEIKLCPRDDYSYDLLIDTVPTIDEIRSTKMVHVSIEHLLGRKYRNTFYYDYEYLEI